MTSKKSKPDYLRYEFGAALGGPILKNRLHRVRSFLETPALELAKKMSGEESGQSMIGRQVGPYSVVSLLAKGGMGEVYRARDTQLQRDVALKLLPEKFASDGERLARFQREAQVLAALNHPNIAQIYGLEGAGTSRCIVMELIDGSTLRNLLADGPLPLKKTMHIAAQVADGLAKAHGAGIVHRDLKPENVMITGDGVAKILDFGLAKLAEPVAENEDIGDAVTLVTRTEASAILGTPGYMSPEQASGRAVDFRSDQFSFGTAKVEQERQGDLLRGVGQQDDGRPVEIVTRWPVAGNRDPGGSVSCSHCRRAPSWH